MKKSILTIIAALAAIALSFAGCNEKGGASGSSKSGGMKFIKMGGSVTVRPAAGSGVFENVSERKPIEIAPFEIADSELTYGKWYEVYEWATSDERGSNKYVFANYGREGSDGTDGNAPTENKNQPVTNISWRDAVVWCNAASEKDGLTPVYKYNGEVLREAEDYKVDNGKAEKATVDASANGYRLPTVAEWEFAALGGNPNAKEWNYSFAGTDDEKSLKDYAVNSRDEGTANVKSKKPNSAGLYDMSGNVFELCYDVDVYWDKNNIRSCRGGDPTGDNFRSRCSIGMRESEAADNTWEYTGFRVVRSEF